MPSIESLQTDRLLARRIGDSDLDVFCRMHQDPRVMATLGGLRSEDETRQWLRNNVNHWERHGFGIWVCSDRTTGDFIGRGGLRHVEVAGNDEVELAYALMSSFWGKGLATEMARAFVDLAFNRLGLGNVVSFTLPTNRASQRVMEKSGFQFERDIMHAGLPHVLYRIAGTQQRVVSRQ